MNFIKAIQHATIGYGIRRKSWRDGATITIDNFGDLYWVEGVGMDVPIKLCGRDAGFDLSPEDIRAQDWEAV